MIGLLLAKAAGAVAAIFVVVAGLALLYVWIATVADLIWAVFLRPALVAILMTSALALSLVGAAWADNALVSLVVAGLATPLVTWAALNFWTWLRAPIDVQPERPSWRGFVRLRWRNAFEAVERRRQRNAYVAPQVLLDSDEG